MTRCDREPSYAELQRRALLAGGDAGQSYGVLKREYADSDGEEAETE